MGNTHKHPSIYTKYTVYLTLKQIHIIHQGGVFSPPSSKYTKYTVYLGSGANTLNTYFPSRVQYVFNVFGGGLRYIAYLMYLRISMYLEPH